MYEIIDFENENYRFFIEIGLKIIFCMETCTIHLTTIKKQLIQMTADTIDQLGCARVQGEPKSVEYYRTLKKAILWDKDSHPARPPRLIISSSGH